MGLDHIRNEIEHMRRQILRQRREIQSLARAGISTTAAEALLARMQEKTDALVAERDREIDPERDCLSEPVAVGEAPNSPVLAIIAKDSWLRRRQPAVLPKRHSSQ